MSRRRLLAWLLTAMMASGAGLFGCGGGGDGGDGAAPASGPALRIAITDAPFPFAAVQSATVEIQRIDIRRTGGGFETLQTFPGGRELDLVQLHNGVTEVLFEGDPGPGEYDAVRIVVLPREVAIDGRPEPITDFAVPSGPQTGIKVFIEPAITVSTHLTQDLVLDFDLSRSFVVQGNPTTPAGIRSFHFQPVIRAVNASTAGSLTFHVLSDNATPTDPSDDFGLDGAAYTVFDRSTDPAVEVASGATGVDPDDPSVHGYAFCKAILAGTYELEVAAADHLPVTVPVTIEAANLTDAGNLTLAVGRVIDGTVTTELDTDAGERLTFVVEGAEVTATEVGGSQPAASGVSDATGAYLVSPLSNGTYNVAANKAGYVEATAADVVPWISETPGAGPVDFVLDPQTGPLSGTVTDAGGQPVAGATVRVLVIYVDSASPAGVEKLMAETTTDTTTGAYALENLPTGTYVVEAQATIGGETKTARADVSHVGGTPSTVNLALP